jgi:NTP pyrophosphatase (non-canonical NTP hydrolase)
MPPEESGTASPPAPDRDEFAAAAAALLDLVRHLSGPDGCPWDKEQTTRTLSPYLVEEAHEIADAIASDDARSAAEEIGDLLFLVTFLAVRLEAEQGSSPSSIARANIAKMIARHPHVFGDRKDLDAQGVLRQWEAGKQKEAGHASGRVRRGCRRSFERTACRRRRRRWGSTGPTSPGCWRRSGRRWTRRRPPLSLRIRRASPKKSAISSSPS